MSDTQCEAQRHDGSRCPRRASRHLDAAVQQRPRNSPAPEPRTIHLCGQHRNSLESGVMAVTLHDAEGGRATVYQDREGRVFWDVYGR